MKPALVLLFAALATASSSYAPDFRDIAAAAGLSDTFPNGGTKTKQYIIETTGSGVAMVDIDNDGLLDIFVASGAGRPQPLVSQPRQRPLSRCVRQFGITRQGWAQGVCAGDYDNDGYTDLFVTYGGRTSFTATSAALDFATSRARSDCSRTAIRYNTGCAFLIMTATAGSTFSSPTT